MRKIFAVSLVLLVVFTGCIRKAPRTSALEPSKPEPPQPDASARSAVEPGRAESAVTESPNTGSSKASAPESADAGQKEAETPSEAVARLFESVNNLDHDKIQELIKQHSSQQDIPDEYFCLLEPISERITCKIGESKIDGDKAEVEITLTVVDAQTAVIGILPAAVAHLAAMQLSGKDVSSPEKILAEYAAKNIDWDSVPTIKTSGTLYLVKGADGEWKIDVSNPENLSLANALGGGSFEVAKKLKSFAERYR